MGSSHPVSMAFWNAALKAARSASLSVVLGPALVDRPQESSHEA